MHQPVSCDEQKVIKEPLDFNKLIEVIHSATPVVGHPLTGPIGKRCFIPVKAKKQNMLFEFFAETILTPQPNDFKNGYDEEDVRTYKGVTVLYLDGGLDSDKEDTQFTGIVWGFEDFLKEFVEDRSMQVILIRILDDIQIEANSIVGEKLLDRANDLWSERMTDEIFKVHLH